MAAEYAQRREKLAGLLLIAAAALALVAANSRLAGAYAALLHWKIGPSLPRMGMLSVEQWIADGLMAGFFLLVGLEVKREWFEGRLATQAQRRLPMIAAAAGMIVPAFVYLLVTGFDPSLSDGWAIPAATDIAFAIGVLALLGTRANPSIKVLLITIAIADDIGAVIIIALFYASDLNLTAIGAALVILAAMIALARLGVRQLWPFMIGFALLWITMLASGIHPTVAGVLTALTIPLGPAGGHSPLKQLEHRLHPWVMFGVMGLFGFASAGVEINGAGELLQPVPLGVLVGLFVGKQLGVFGALWLAVKSGLCAAPANVRWIELYGAALLCGIGFTMSLFIGALAFPAAPETVEAAKIGTLAGSLLSALCGWAILRFARRPVSHREDAIAAEQVFAADQPD